MGVSANILSLTVIEFWRGVSSDFIEFVEVDDEKLSWIPKENNLMFTGLNRNVVI